MSFCYNIFLQIVKLFVDLSFKKVFYDLRWCKIEIRIPFIIQDFLANLCCFLESFCLEKYLSASSSINSLKNSILLRFAFQQPRSPM